ncbi:MAG TPA: DUF4252 domain-containing protein [Saprospiraceae bacterium]|nr:DUF4252 domain-containing protein [Saprospiraceae bacterium]HNT21597.1 DUF4252 domain-containing protein [Saprospiraceae bacterium]
MKTLIFSLFCTLCLSALSTAQEQSLNQFVRANQNRDGIRHFSIPGFLVRLAGGIALREEDQWQREAMRPLVRNLGSISVMFSDGGEGFRDEDVRTLKKNLVAENYEPLVSLRDNGSRVEVFAWQKKDILRRVVFLIHEKHDESVLVSLRGHFTQDDISKMLRSFEKEEII